MRTRATVQTETASRDRGSAFALGPRGGVPRPPAAHGAELASRAASQLASAPRAAGDPRYERASPRPDDRANPPIGKRVLGAGRSPSSSSPPARLITAVNRYRLAHASWTAERERRTGRDGGIRAGQILITRSSNRTSVVAITWPRCCWFGLAAVVIAERNRLAQLASSTLFLRVRSWAIIAPIFVLAVFAGGLSGVSAGPRFRGATGRGWSTGRLVRLHRATRGLLCLWILVGLLVARAGQELLPVLPLWFVPAAARWSRSSRRVATRCDRSPGVLYGSRLHRPADGLPGLHQGRRNRGAGFLLVTGFAVALADVCAFAVGSVFKGPKLAPGSAEQTWSGVLGSLLGAAWFRAAGSG